MRRFEWESYQRTLGPIERRIYAQSGPKRTESTVRRRPRAAGERELLSRQTLRSWQQAVASGRIEILGKRKFRWHIPEVTDDAGVDREAEKPIR